MNTVVASRVRHSRFLFFGFILTCGACSSEKKANQSATAASSDSVASIPPGGMRSRSEWLPYNGRYEATRYSSLIQINTSNVSSRAEVARLKLPRTTAFQSGPVLVDVTMYVPTPNTTYALDARTAEQRSIQKFERMSAGIGTPVRGAGYADGRLFRGTPDGHLLPLDAKTGTGIRTRGCFSPPGNSGPDFVASHRPGDNLHTSSAVMLDARTGALHGYHVRDHKEKEPQ
jgi:glucose dehydrogenase